MTSVQEEENKEGPSIPGVYDRPNVRYEPNEDEKRILKQCRLESFYFRCVPLSFAFVAVTQTLVARGILAPHPRHGALFKNMGAALLGYVVGKVSYNSKCREKLMQLDNSPIADALRSGKGAREFLQELAVPTSQQPEATFESQPMRLGDDHRSTDINSDSNVALSGLDDHARPSVDRDDEPVLRRESTTPSQTLTSYEDLRKKNREEHNRKTAAVSGGTPNVHPLPPPGPMDPGSTYSQRPPTQGSQRPGPVRRNQYGDIIEE